jgi:hypothetical protein
MSLQGFNRRIAALDAKLQPASGLFTSAIWLPGKPGDTYEADTRLPVIIYDPATGAPLPGFEDIVARLHPACKEYGFNPDEDGSEP